MNVDTGEIVIVEKVKIKGRRNPKNSRYHVEGSKASLREGGYLNGYSITSI